MIPITEKMIKSEYFQKSSYQKGLFYFFSGFVSDFKYDKQNNKITASVTGSRPYNVEIKFSSDGEISKTSCDCPDCTNHLGNCKHCIAVLKYAQAEYSKELKESIFKENLSQNIINYFENYSNSEDFSKKILNTKFEFELLSSYSYNFDFTMKIGLEKLYVVKSLKDLLTSFKEKRKLEYGKSFTYNPDLYKFSETDENVISILSELLDFENHIYNVNYYSSSIFKGKKACLSSGIILKIFKILENQNITLVLNSIEYENVTITSENLPISFNIEENKYSGFKLKLENIKKLIPLSNDSSCFFYNKKIYLVNEQQQMILKPFLSAIEKNTDTINFKNSQNEFWISNILPFMQDRCSINVSKAIQKNIITEDLKTEIYFDFTDNLLKAKIKFIYGEYIINPFGSTENKISDNKILMRNILKENSIMAIFENSSFLVNKDYLYIEDNDKILDFIYNTLPLLQKTAEIYYSDSFKNIKITENNRFSVGIKFNMNGSVMEMNVNYGDVPSEELDELFNSFVIKKKYHKLKDGTFIPINQEMLSSVSNILDYIDVPLKNINNGILNLPVNRALYLNEKFNNMDNIKVESEFNFDNFIKKITTPLEADFIPPNETAHFLRSYQLTGFKWLKTLAHYKLGGILADDMGLGKTLQTITFLLSQKEENPKLNIVICPTSLVYNWVDEINKFAPSLNMLVVSGNPITRQELLKNIDNIDLIVTSYPLIRRDIELYENLKFGYCFLDEAQNIKNPDSLNAKSVKQIKADGYFALTGTPIENSLTEMWSIFDFIMPGYLFSHNKFTKKYEKPIMKEQNQDILNELSQQIKPFILRRMKKEVLSELPEKIETKMYAPLTADQEKTYLAYMNHIQSKLSEEIAINGYEKSQMKILAALTRLRQICCHPAMFIENYHFGSGKLDLLMEILEEALSGEHRILIFSQFTSMLQIIAQKLIENQISYFYLDGNTKSELRNEYVKKFNSGEKDIFLISLKAGGTGLNLTGADTVIHYDPWWNPAVEQQATDRAYRIGQNNSVQVIKLITKDTIEEKIYELQEKKQTLINSVINSGETFISRMTEEEIKKLFEID